MRRKILYWMSLLVAGVIFSPLVRQYWAFQKVKRSEIPKIQNSTLVCTPIDNFILARLEAEGFSLSVPAEKTTLLRRATFDLTDPPPTEHQVDEYLAHYSPYAFEKAMDRLLALPHYARSAGLGQ